MAPRSQKSVGWMALLAGALLALALGACGRSRLVTPPPDAGADAALDAR